jgi:polyhydroxyalkanoate synthesis repressor PhaR
LAHLLLPGKDSHDLEASFHGKEIHVNSGPPSAANGGASHAACEAATRTIKRYVNRKLYDTIESRYVTLDEIAHMIKLGDQVQVVEERTERDLTGVTLLQIILEEQRRSSKVSARLLCELIRGGTCDSPSPAERSPVQAQEAAKVIQDGAEQRLQVVLERGQQASDRAKEMVAASQQAVLQLQQKMNERVGAAFEVVAAVGKLKRELAHIAGRIEYIDERLSGIRDDAPPELVAQPRRAELRPAAVART